jgi:hypothetical protein
MAYRILEIPHPYKYKATITTVQGPGVVPETVVDILGYSIDNQIPPDKLVLLQKVLTDVFIMGRRAAQHEMRVALGIRNCDD